MSYRGSVKLISGLAPQGNFPVASAADIYVDDNHRLSQVIQELTARLAALEGADVTPTPSPAPQAAVFGSGTFGTAVFG